MQFLAFHVLLCKWIHHKSTKKVDTVAFRMAESGKNASNAVARFPFGQLDDGTKG